MSEHWVTPDGTWHEFYTGSIFVGNSFLGSFRYDSGRADLLYYRESFAFFCPECGDVWGRIAAKSSLGRPLFFRAVPVACARHHDWWNVPGSILANQLEHVIDLLPPEALIREFQIHLAYAEKELAV